MALDAYSICAMIGLRKEATHVVAVVVGLVVRVDALGVQQQLREGADGPSQRGEKVMKRQDKKVREGAEDARQVGAARRCGTSKGGQE